MPDIYLTVPQAQFSTLLAEYSLFVGGYGCGKTYTLAYNVASDVLTIPPVVPFAVFMPTYSMLAEVTVPTISKMFDAMGIRYSYNKTEKSFIDLPNGATVILKSMEDPSKIAGAEYVRIYVDELETMPFDKGLEAWNNITARGRAKVRHRGKVIQPQIRVYTTPNGGKRGITWKLWGVNETLPPEEQRKRSNYAYVRAPTWSNIAHLSKNYILNLYNLYPSALVNAYLAGEWVNMENGLVYSEYDRVKCRNTFTVTKDDAAIYVGMDFNVGHMAAVVFIRQRNTNEDSLYPWKYHAVREFVDLDDTPAMIKRLKAEYPEKRITIFPDCAGVSRRSADASVSDITLLQQAGFVTRYHPAHPAVKDRVLAMNRGFKSGDVTVNDLLCPKFAEALCEQTYDDKGEPDKTTGIDHVLDAPGYLVEYEMPIRRKNAALVPTYGQY